jgi:thioesterase domain-containing protein/acyl carrier protein
LANGACLVIADRQRCPTADALEKFLACERITTATLTPSLLELLRPEVLPDLHTICAVGEPLSAELAARWAPGHHLINGYGVSEAAIGACLMEIDAKLSGRPPIGRPLKNVRLYVLDKHLQPLPVGVPGELCIGGVQVGRGYLNRPELTARVFLPDPFAPEPAARLYRTGDLGRLRSDGYFEFLGRMDEQANIRGYRVEPEEVADTLRQHPAVGQAAVIVREDQPGQQRLVAYLAPVEGRQGRKAALTATLPEIRAWLKARLPDYMMPSALVVLERLLRLPNGKLDRRSLPPPPAERPQWSPEYCPPRDEIEQTVAAVWEELLGIRPVGVKDDFFELGGHSLLAVRVVGELERRLGRRVPLAAMFRGATVEHLAQLLRAPESCPPETSLIPLETRGVGRPLFCIHPAGGTVFCYRDLARHIAPPRPVYGLQAVGVDGTRPPLERIEDMAAHYLAAIRGAQPRGPYLLAGWSLGGNIAYEMAQQLTHQGDEVAMLALLDTAALPPDRPPDQRDFLPFAMDFFPEDEHLPLETLEQMPWQEQLEYFVHRASRARVVLSGEDFAATRHVFEVFRACMKAIMDYRQKPYPGKVTLLAAEHNESLFGAARDPWFGWGHWALGGVEVHRVPGGHIRMMLEPQVAVLADILRQCMEPALSPAKAQPLLSPLAGSRGWLNPQ